MKIDEDFISEMSSILKLKFSETETKEVVKETNETLSMLETLQEVDTKGVKGTYYGAVKHKTRFREDHPVQDEAEVAAMLENTQTSVDQLIQVPAILDEGEGGA